jgi:nucleoside-diphosphate-sugar epimerase
MIKGKKVLVTGATGQVAKPIVDALLEGNEVWCAARFSEGAKQYWASGGPNETGARQRLEACGAKTFRWTLGSDDFRGLPDDFDYVIHCAWNVWDVGNDFDAAIALNAEGTGLLMNHVKRAKGFLFVSSIVVYQDSDDPRHAFMERTEPLGCRVTYAPPYSISKIAGEAAVRTLSRVFDLPVTIARLGMAYGRSGHGGVPCQIFRALKSGQPIYLPTRSAAVSMIHQDDIVTQVEPLLRAAAVPATIVNWVADEIVDEVELYSFIGNIAGIEPQFVVDDGKALGVHAADTTLRRTITGPSLIGWKAGVLKTLREVFPDHEFRSSEKLSP